VEAAVIQNFVKGIVFGGVVAGLGLGVVSELAPKAGEMASNQTEVPLVQPEDAAPVVAATPEVTAEPKVEAKPSAAAADAPAVATPVAPAPAEPVASMPADSGAPASDAADPASPVAADPAAAGPADPVAPAPDAAEPVAPAADAVASAAPQPEPVMPVTPPEVAPDAPSLLDAPVEGNAPDILTQSDPAALPGSPKALPDAMGGDAPPLAEAAPAPPAPEEPLLSPAPAPAMPAPAQIVMDPPVVVPPPKLIEPPRVIAPPSTASLPPATGLPKTVDGVKTGRLPSIGVAPAAEEQVPLLDAAPMVKFARAFSNDAGKPLFAVVLQDTGAADLDRAALAALPFAITFALDPLDPSAAEAEKIYRAGGQEVVMLASGIPKGANAGDLEQSFQANEAVLPEAVAVMDIGAGGFQDNRPLATQVVPLIAEQGRGLLTFDKGLNAADQVARRDGVPAAVIFRELDAGGEDTPLIRRYLDRAAFKAAQEGRVVVLGSTRPETIAALMAWSVEGRGAAVALAPLTAVLTK
jgi:uncharacterized protein